MHFDEAISFMLIYRYNDDGTPKATPIKDKNNNDVVFTTNTEDGKDGYVSVELKDSVHGQNLQANTTYYLHEIQAPSGYAINDIYYQFTINKDGTVNYNNYHFLDGDVMKIRNTPESVDFIVSKEIKGNVTLTTEDMEAIKFKLQKFNTTTNEWEDYIPSGETVSPYSAVSYKDFTDSEFTTFRSLKQGKYRLIESGNNEVRSAHSSSRFSASMIMDDNVGCSVSDTTSTTYDGIQIDFDITRANLQDAEPRTVKVTNTYSVATVDKKVIKRWYNCDCTTEINWPMGLKVQLDIYRYDPATSQTEGNPVQSITLDGVADQNGEFVPGQATFLNLPKNKEVNTNEGPVLVDQIYAVKEVTQFKGYQPENNNPVMAFYDTSTSQSKENLTFKNVKKATSFSVKKNWLPEKPANASATFRLFSYTGTDISKARMVEDMELPNTTGSTEEEQWTAVFEDLPMVNDQDVPLNYIAKEINCTPGYEAYYTGNDNYSGNNGTITNKPAKTNFGVTVQWDNISGNEWPNGITLNLRLLRRPKGTTGTDPNFRLPLSLPGNGTDQEFQQGNDVQGAADTYPVKYKKRSPIKYQLAVEDLDKFFTDENGNLVEWEYYVEQVVNVRDDSVYSVTDVSTEYANKNRAPLNGFASNNGLITNTLPTVSLQVSKHVSGSFASHFKYFEFTITLGSGENKLNGNVPCVIKSDKVGAPENNITVAFTDGSATVKLRHGETLVIPDLTLGTTYSVTETPVNGYTSTITGNASGEVNDNTVSFLNTRDGTVPTGVTVGCVSAGALLLLSAGAFLLLLRKKAMTRRKSGEV